MPPAAWRMNMTESKMRPMILRAGIVVAGYFGSTFLLFILDSAITQPHPVYVSGTWLTYAARNALFWALRFGVGVAVIVTVDLGVQRIHGASSKRDLRFYPTVKGLRNAVRAPMPRLVMVAGLLLLGGYYALVEIAIWETSRRPHGLIWPPHRLFVVCLISWGVLWIADCLRRPGGGTIVGAIAFTTWATLSTLSIAFGCLVE